MMRGKVTAVDASGVYVQTAEYGTLGPCQAVVANYAVADMVLCVNVGDEASPELVVVGRLTTSTGSLSGVQILNIAKDSYPYIQISGNAGTGPFIALSTDGVGRWALARNDDAETGSNAGSDFHIQALSDAGGNLGFPVRISRATGKVTFGSPSAGLEMGSGGPTWTVGTGVPSHSAPNGSLHSRTDGGSGTTLYVRESGSWVGK